MMNLNAFSHLGTNFQIDSTYQQLVSSKLMQNHQGAYVHYESPQDNAVTEVDKYGSCVAPSHCQDQSDTKYFTTQSVHHQYSEVQRPCLQLPQQVEPEDMKRTDGKGPVGPWQGLVAPGMADYLARLPTALPLSLHHFLKFSSDNCSRDQSIGAQTLSISVGVGQSSKKKQTRKTSNKQNKFKPKAEIRITTALDGSTLFCCPECHMAYPQKELLERHIGSHKTERRFVCDICGTGLKRKDHLTRHKQSHNPDRPFVCGVCMKAFKRKEHLNLHFVMHSGEKKHVCSECGKGFYCKDHLDRHKQGHKPERPFVCSICMKGFKRNEHLLRHCIIHSGDKSQVCPECGKGFYRKDHLRKHLRSHLAKRVKTEQGVIGCQSTPGAVASIAAMVSMSATMLATPDGGSLPLLSSPV